MYELELSGFMFPHIMVVHFSWAFASLYTSKPVDLMVVFASTFERAGALMVRMVNAIIKMTIVIVGRFLGVMLWFISVCEVTLCLICIGVESCVRVYCDWSFLVAVTLQY